MNIIHLLTKIRYEIIFQAKLEFREDILEYIIKLYYQIPYLKKGIRSYNKDKRKLIVSLTTIPSRINKVWMTVESLLRQTRKPDKIILWIAEDEFEGITIPDNLKKQERRGLEIRYCENLRSYKKFYYSMMEYPKDYVLIVDDDSIYSEKMIEAVLDTSAENPNCIVCNRSHRIRTDGSEMFNYLRWGLYDNRGKISSIPSYQNFFTGNGGVLFPVWLLDKSVFNKKVFMEIAPTGDDVWLNFVGWKSKIKIVNTKGIFGFIIPIQSSSENGLFVDNLSKTNGNCECKNDIQIKNVLKYFNINIKNYI